MEQANSLESSNIKVNNIDNQFFEIRLETNATIKSLATLTLYNWQLADAMDSLVFPTVLYMWNSIRYTDDNGKSSTLHRHFIQSNSDLCHIQGNMGLINNINNKTITLWQTIIKASASTMLDADVEIGDNVASTHDSVQLCPIQQGMEFLPTLFNNI